MEQLLQFFNQYGLDLTLIAIAGIILLGILKYNKVFDKLDENYRHYIYLGVSVTFSVVSSTIYLACMKTLNASYVFILAGALYVLNQTFYSIFKTLSLNELLKKIIEGLRSTAKNLIDKANTENKDTDKKDEI